MTEKPDWTYEDGEDGFNAVKARRDEQAAVIERVREALEVLEGLAREYVRNPQVHSTYKESAGRVRAALSPAPDTGHDFLSRSTPAGHDFLSRSTPASERESLDKWLATQGLHIVTDADKAVLDAMAEAKHSYITSMAKTCEGPKEWVEWMLLVLNSELTRREAKR